MLPIEEKIAALKQQAEGYILETKEELEKFRLGFLAKNGSLNALFAEFKTVAPEKRKEVGALLNSFKNFAEAKFKEAEALVAERNVSVVVPPDLTLPSVPYTLGSRHPLSLIREQIVRIFAGIGFNLSEGPEIEDDWHNFSALNFPENHPARDMQDTFFVETGPDITLRTHTSSVQVRVMERMQPPIRTISPGRVFRNEAISARAHCVFHQVEGLYINENVSFADLKQTLYYFVKEMFGKKVKIRFRPSYFPFTEPSAEIDIDCQICHGEGCNVCKYSGWVEIAGAGMVDPNVLKNCNIDPERYTGFAFGMGLERMAMLKYEVRDLRLYTENDIRFLRQFSGRI